jgi:hypothetical protein
MGNGKQLTLKLIFEWRKNPLLVPEVGSFSNAKTFVLNQLKAETKKLKNIN